MLKPSKRAAIVDYGMGNLFSVQRALEHVGLEAVISHDPKVISGCDAIVLPGVGAFGDAMANLKKLDLIEPLKGAIKSGKPFLGICLGMQLLFSRSEEFGFHEGLGVIPGAVIRFPDKDGADRIAKVPQVGWNGILAHLRDGWRDSPLDGLENGEYMYFVHSYYCQPQDPTLILSQTTYHDVSYCSSLRKRNVFATQFHPEKSGPAGLKIYKNWSQRIS